MSKNFDGTSDEFTGYLGQPFYFTRPLTEADKDAICRGEIPADAKPVEVPTEDEMRKAADYFHKRLRMRR